MESITNGRKEVVYSINSLNYIAKVSLRDILYLDECSSKELVDYRKYTAEKILEHTSGDNKPNVEQIESQPDEFFKEIFDCFLLDNSDFLELYSSCESTEICERYALSYRRYLLNITVDKAAQIPQAINTALIDVAEKAASIVQEVNFDFLESIAEKINSAMSWYADNASKIIGSLASALEGFAKISENLLSGISDFITEINVPEYSEEEKQKLIKAYRQWGKFGWTIPPNSYLNSFHNCPDTLLEADKAALQFCKNQDMEELFISLEALCKRKKDIREAIECYHHRHYKACALILFSLIDSRIIRLQSKNEKYGVGIGAISKFKKIAKEKTTNEGKLFLALSYENIFPCLFTMFEDTNNFTKKQTIINRNYLDHGISYKSVRKKDCIKLFLLLYNMLEFIEIIK